MAKTNSDPENTLSSTSCNSSISAAPNPDPLSNFANLPFSSPDPSAVSFLWNAAQPFLTLPSSGSGRGGGADEVALFGISPSGVADDTVAGEEAAGIVAEVELSIRAYEFLTAVSLRVDSLELAVRYAGMNGLGQHLSMKEQREESWNVLLPQVMDVVMAVGIASRLCKDQPHKITTSGILPTLHRLIETAAAVSSPPNFYTKLIGSSLLDATSFSSRAAKKEYEKVTFLTSFHAEFLQCCILSHQYRYAQRFLHSHPVHSHSLVLSSNNSSTSSNNTVNNPRLDSTSYLRYHYFSGLVHMKCEDWQAALSSFQLCLTIPCLGGNLNAVSSISIAARKKMLLIQCWLLEADEMDGPSNEEFSEASTAERKSVGSKSKKSTVENKVFEMPGSASQVMCRYMSNPSNRVGAGDRSSGGEEPSAPGSIPDRAGTGGEAGEERREDYHSTRRKHRQHPSSSSDGSGTNDRGPPLTSGQMKNIRQLGRYHDLVSTYISGNASHYATLLSEMHDSLVEEENWELAKRLEGRLVYRAVRELASVYAVVGMDALERKVREKCGASVQELMGARRRVEDALMGMAGSDWEDVLISDPFYAHMDQLTNIVGFVEEDSDAIANQETEEQWLEHDLSKRMESCIVLAERVRDLDIQLTTSTKYQHQIAKWEVKADASTKQGQGVTELGHAPMDVGVDF